MIYRDVAKSRGIGSVIPSVDVKNEVSCGCTLNVVTRYPSWDGLSWTPVVCILLFVHMVDKKDGSYNAILLKVILLLRIVDWMKIGMEVKF